jgi:hypothetical protein
MKQGNNDGSGVSDRPGPRGIFPALFRTGSGCPCGRGQESVPEFGVLKPEGGGVCSAQRA